MDGPFNDVEKSGWVVLNVPSLAPIERLFGARKPWKNGDFLISKVKNHGSDEQTLVIFCIWGITLPIYIGKS